jgi:uncharacterized protein YndB with AHSA1/START domain
VSRSGATPRPLPGPREPGEVTADGELASLVFRRFFRHPPEAVWEAITSPAHIRLWWMTEAKIDPRKGGAVDFVTGPTRVHSMGTILEWDPPRLYEYAWRIPPTETVTKGESAIVRWELTPTNGGTLLVLTHRKLTRETAALFARGLSAFLDRLAAVLDGTPPPEPAWLRDVH